MKTENIKIYNHTGTWHVIDQTKYNGNDVYLLEHGTWGDMTENLIVDKNLNILLDDVWNGFDDLEYLEY